MSTHKNFLQSKLPPHVKRQIIDFCQQEHGNRLSRILCGIRGSGKSPHFQAELTDGRVYAYSGPTMAPNYGVEHAPGNLVEIWPSNSASTRPNAP